MNFMAIAMVLVLGLVAGAAMGLVTWGLVSRGALEP